MTGFAEVFEQERVRVRERPIDVWVRNLSDTDRDAFESALRSDVSTSAIWRAARASGGSFDRDALGQYRKQFLEQQGA